MKALISRFFGRPKPELVPYYDIETKTTRLIPKAELRPGIVLIRVKGKAGAVYADSAQLQPGKHRHSSFNEAMRAAIAKLAADLAEVYPKSSDEWEDGFRKDEEPEQEIAGWIHLSAVLKTMAERFTFSLAEKKECFRILVACFTGARETARDRSDPKLLSKQQVSQTIAYFYEGGYD